MKRAICSFIIFSQQRLKSQGQGGPMIHITFKKVVGTPITLSVYYNYINVYCARNGRSQLAFVFTRGNVIVLAGYRTR